MPLSMYGTLDQLERDSNGNYPCRINNLPLLYLDTNSEPLCHICASKNPAADDAPKPPATCWTYFFEGEELYCVNADYCIDNDKGCFNWIEPVHIVEPSEA